MKQQLPLLEPQIEEVPKSEKTVALREEIDIINYPSESKNMNYLRNKYSRKPTTFSIDSKETRIINNLNINQNLNSINSDKIGKQFKKSFTSKNFLYGYKKVNTIEERREKKGNTSMTNIIKESIPRDQMALKISIEEIKRKNEDLKKKIELKESQAFYKMRSKLEKIVNSNFFVIFFMILTFFIMFIADIQNCLLPSDSDNIINALQTTILVLLTIEIILTCLAKEGYINSFFFWLDLVSSLSIIQDIGFIFDPLLTISSPFNANDEIFTELTNTTDIGTYKSLKGVNQALGKITAVSRITRILKIIRVIRLIRIVKFYKNAMLVRGNIFKKRKERQKCSKKNILSVSSISNSSNPVNNLGLELKNMGRRFSKSSATPIKRDSVNLNNSNENMKNENYRENINKSNNYIVSAKNNENNQERVMNDCLQITNVININQNDLNFLPPKIEIDLKTYFNRDTAPSFDPKYRQSKSSIALTQKQPKLIIEERQKVTELDVFDLQKSQKEIINPPQKSLKPRQEINLENLLSESKTSKIVTEAITKKVIILILSILIMQPILDDSLYAKDDVLSYNILSKYISNYYWLYSNASIRNYLPPKLNNSLWELILNEADEYFPIINITSYQSVLFINSTWENYAFRKSELSTAISPDNGVVIIYSLLFDTKTVALINILKTICLCILITVATVYFEGDVKSLVLDPLEIMIEIVQKVAKNPIKAKNWENLETGMKSTISKIKKEDESTSKKKKCKKAEDEYEVQIIQNAIMKISALLAIGIGEAGNEIIKENLSNYNDLDPMVKGRKKNAIFGFCDIRGFPQVNEVLQEDTMVFLNEIADIVHSSVDLFEGSTNKNIGDAFLMVWKLPNESNQLLPQIEAKDSNNNSPLSLKKLMPGNHIIKHSDHNIINKIENNHQNPEVNLTPYKNFLKLNQNKNISNLNFKNHNNKILISTEVSRIADSAVFGYLKVIAKINRDLGILSYRENEKIKEKIKDFKVNMGFGLHMGWAIEGAIGSSYKIDASYLSPNVNMAARLEAATRQYGVSIIISGPLYDLISGSVKKICRLIDIVTVKGSVKPVKLYTIDINENIKPSKKPKKSISDKQSRLKHMNKKRQLKLKIEEYGVFEAMMKKRYFRQMLRNTRPSIFNLFFKHGFNAYLNGNWELAAKKFDECLSFYDSDGPTKTLLNFIKENNFQAPQNWKGFRALTSK